MNTTNNSKEYSRFEYLFLNDGGNSTIGRHYEDSSGRPVNPPKGFSMNDQHKGFYREVRFHLANTDQTENISYFEHLTLKNKTCAIYIISPKALQGKTEVFEGDTIEKAKHACLNQVAFRIERYCGNTVGCHSEYRDMLAPINE